MLKQIGPFILLSCSKSFNSFNELHFYLIAQFIFVIFRCEMKYIVSIFQEITSHVDEKQTLERANLTRVTSPPNSNAGGLRLILYVPFSYFLSIIYLPRCTLSDFPSVSSLVFLPFLPCCNRTTIV